VAAGHVRGVGVAAGPVPGLGVALTEALFGIPFGIAKVITPPFQALLQFLRILHVLRGKFQSTGSAHCSRFLPRSSHAPCHSSLSGLGTGLWRAFFKSCLSLNNS